MCRGSACCSVCDACIELSAVFDCCCLYMLSLCVFSMVVLLWLFVVLYVVLDFMVRGVFAVLGVVVHVLVLCLWCGC